MLIKSHFNVKYPTDGFVKIFLVLQDKPHQVIPSVSLAVNSLLAELTQKLVTVKFVFKRVPKLLKSKPRNILLSLLFCFKMPEYPKSTVRGSV